MHVRVEVVVGRGGGMPPAGSAVVVRVLDAALQDVAAAILAETRGTTAEGPVIAVAELDVPRPGTYPIVHVHVDVDGDGRVSMQSYPCGGWPRCSRRAGLAAERRPGAEA